MIERDEQADLLELANCLLQSYDFQELGFSARRPFGNSSDPTTDILQILEIDDRKYANRLWAKLRPFLSKCSIINPATKESA